MHRTGHKDNTRNGRCSRCGGCCTSLLPVTDEELRIIRNYAAKNGIRPSVPDRDEFITTVCPFRRVGLGTSDCTIYPVRPAICRAFLCSQTQAQTAMETCRLIRGRLSDEPQNLWQLFDMTGVRAQGVDMPWKDATASIVTTDEGETYRFQIGRCVTVAMDGGKLLSGMVVNVNQEGIHVMDRQSHEIVMAPYDKIRAVLSPSAKINEKEI